MQACLSPWDRPCTWGGGPGTAPALYPPEHDNAIHTQFCPLSLHPSSCQTTIRWTCGLLTSSCPSIHSPHSKQTSLLKTRAGSCHARLQTFSAHIPSCGAGRTLRAAPCSFHTLSLPSLPPSLPLFLPGLPCSDLLSCSQASQACSLRLECSPHNPLPDWFLLIFHFLSMACLDP